MPIDDHGDRCPAADADHLRLARVRPPLRIEVDREQRGRGVEHAGERAHQRGQKSGDDETAKARREDRLHHQRKRRLCDLANRLAVGPDHDRERRNLAALGEREADETGNDEQVHRRQLQERGADRAAACDLLVRRSEHALDDVLVRAPVPEADDRRAEEHADPREIAVEVPRLPNRAVPAASVSMTGAHVPSTPGGTSGFHRLNMSDGRIARSSPQPPSRFKP